MKQQAKNLMNLLFQTFIVLFVWTFGLGIILSFWMFHNCRNKYRELFQGVQIR